MRIFDTAFYLMYQKHCQLFYLQLSEKKMELIMYNIIKQKNNFASEFVVRIDTCPDLGT